MRNVDVVHRDPEQTRRNFSHQPLGNVEGKFVRTGECTRVRPKIIDGKLQDRFQLLKFELTSSKLRRVKRRLIVVAKQVLVIRSTRCCCGKQVLRKNYARAKAGAVRPITALTNMV